MHPFSDSECGRMKVLLNMYMYTLRRAIKVESKTFFFFDVVLKHQCHLITVGNSALKITYLLSLSLMFFSHFICTLFLSLSFSFALALPSNRWCLINSVFIFLLILMGNCWEILFFFCKFNFKIFIKSWIDFWNLYAVRQIKHIDI